MSVLDGINNALGGASAAPAAAMPQATPMGEMSAPNTMSAPNMAMGPMNVESILGLNPNDVGTYEGGAAWPKGVYQFQLTGIETGEYDIKTEGHPWEGKKAFRIEFQLTCIGVVPMAYIDAKGETVPEAQMQEFIGKVYKDSCMFANDGLVKQGKAYRLPMAGEKPDFPGAKRLNTMLRNILGKETYEQIMRANPNAGFGPALQAVNNIKFACIIDHNINPNDPNKRVQDQVAMFEEFVQLA